MSRILTLVCTTGLVMANFASAGERLKSGPEVGKPIPGVFDPIVVLHAELPDHAGKKWAFVEQYGANPSVLIFARTINEPLALLLAKLDGAMAKYRDVKKKGDPRSAPVYGVVVMLSDEAGMDQQLKKLAKQLRIKNLSFAIDNGAGLRSYQLVKDADITVLVVNRRKVEANHAFRKNELRDTNVQQIMADLRKIVAPAEALESGPQLGTIILGDACQRPTLLVIARGLSEPLASLVKRIDDKLTENKARDLRCLAMLLSDDEQLPEKLKALRQRQAIKHVALEFDNPDGWQRVYGVAKEAEVTIVLYVKRKVLANHAYRKGELDENAIECVLQSIDDRLSTQDGPIANASAGDLSKIERTIGKEPAYQSKPKYCLVVFGPEAKSRVWLVLDGETLFAGDGGDVLVQVGPLPARHVGDSFSLSVSVNRREGEEPSHMIWGRHPRTKDSVKRRAVCSTLATDPRRRRELSGHRSRILRK
ncbi:MAG: hypothetical protein L0Y72_17845 [Gemmataceae bacterium]|nr:hypothetical protein [Gemmataceae bacterium]MCI0740913.1 hypothetical protein [Gemmataceae bacterium]